MDLIRVWKMPWEKEMAAHSLLAWEIPQTEGLVIVMGFESGTRFSDSAITRWD